MALDAKDLPLLMNTRPIKGCQCDLNMKDLILKCNVFTVNILVSLIKKHPDRNKFEEVRTKGTGIHRATLEICMKRDDKLGKTIESRLLNVSDLVAAEAKYHIACRTNFENPLPKNKTSGRPVSTEKMTLFNEACKQLEDDVELYTVSEFYNMMSKLGNDTYTLKMTQAKLQEKYGESIRLVTREGKSNIILLDRVGDILSEKWYEERKTNLTVESERIVITAAKLLKDTIKNYEHETSTYPSTDDVTSTENNCVPHLLQIVMNELVKSPLKQMSLSQALFTATRPRSIMPLQFGLAVAVDNRLASKWLTNLLNKLGLAVSYDEVRMTVTERKVRFSFRNAPRLKVFKAQVSKVALISIEQILMKSLKGRSGVIGKGITENVMHMWTKTMHRLTNYVFSSKCLYRFSLFYSSIIIEQEHFCKS